MNQIKHDLLRSAEFCSPEFSFFHGESKDGGGNGKHGGAEGWFVANTGEDAADATSVGDWERE